MPIVNIKWIKLYLDKEYEEFIKKYNTRSVRIYKPCGACPKCGREHFSGEFTTWYSFWTLEEFLRNKKKPLEQMKLNLPQEIIDKHSKEFGKQLAKANKYFKYKKKRSKVS
jgi:hypothetical protein